MSIVQNAATCDHTSVAYVFSHQVEPPVPQPQTLTRSHPLTVARQLTNFQLPGKIPPIMLA